MKRYKRFLLLWSTNIVLLYSANMLLPTHFTLGNDMFTLIQSAFFVGFIWNVVLWNIEPTFKDMEIKLKGMMPMMLSYLAINFATIWILARLAVITGFGVSSFVYVFGLAFVANFVQYQVWEYTEKK